MQRSVTSDDLKPLVIVFALQNSLYFVFVYFVYFVYGMQVVVRTDHLPLMALFKRHCIAQSTAVDVRAASVQVDDEVRQRQSKCRYGRFVERGKIPVDGKEEITRHPGEDEMVCGGCTVEWIQELK